MTKTIINETPYRVAARFAKYSIHAKPSSNVAFFGHHEDKCFIQFKNGSAYFYQDVAPEVIQGALEAESIGKFYNAEISRKHTSVKLTESVITKID